MRNVQMIRKEPGLVSIAVEKAVYCQNCEMVSTSAWQRYAFVDRKRLWGLRRCSAGRQIRGRRLQQYFLPQSASLPEPRSRVVGIEERALIFHNERRVATDVKLLDNWHVSGLVSDDKLRRISTEPQGVRTLQYAYACAELSGVNK